MYMCQHFLAAFDHIKFHESALYIVNFILLPLMYIFMLHVFEVTQFPVCPEGVDGRLEWTGQLLQGNTDVVLAIQCRTETISKYKQFSEFYQCAHKVNSIELRVWKNV